jgi:hypothetical protein
VSGRSRPCAPTSPLEKNTTDGLVERHPGAEDYLLAPGQSVVEEPGVVETRRDDGGTARRAVVYYEDARGLMINLRVLVDLGDDDVVALLESATRDPKVLAAFVDDVDRFVAGLSLDRAADGTRPPAGPAAPVASDQPGGDLEPQVVATVDEARSRSRSRSLPTRSAHSSAACRPGCSSR